jgi:hypothetical protein
LDPFSSYLKGRLENHKSPVDPEGWDKIAGYLKRRKRIRTGWIASGIAAAILLAVLWLSVPIETEAIREQIAEQETATTTPPVETPAIKTIEAAPVLAFAAKRKKPEEPVKEVIAESNIPQEDRISQENNEPREDNEPQKTNERQSETRKQPNEARKQPERSKNEPFIPAELPKKKKSGKWLLAVVTGTGGGDVSIGFPSQNENLSLNTPSQGDERPNPITPPVYTDVGNIHYQNREYADMIHTIPLSAGITVRKDISRDFAVETGLLYTYLYSELKKNRISKSDKLQLHYLGVPFNLVGYMVNKPHWNMYVSGGVMFEKGLKSTLTVREYVAGKTVSATENYSIPGIQVSLNGAIGFSYRLADHWSLYAEPKLYYYFDANQPPSIRTEHPFGFGANGGIRYNF